MKDEQSLREARGTLPQSRSLLLVATFHCYTKQFSPQQINPFGFAGLIVAQAAEQLGQEVLLRHFLVTVQGRTGYLEPQWEDCSVTGTAAALAVLTL